MAKSPTTWCVKGPARNMATTTKSCKQCNVLLYKFNITVAIISKTNAEFPMTSTAVKLFQPQPKHYRKDFSVIAPKGNTSNLEYAGVGSKLVKVLLSNTRFV